MVGALDESDSGAQQIAVYDVSTRSAFMLGFRGAEAKTERGRQRLQILLNSAVGFGNVRSEVDAAELLVDVAQRAFAATFASVHLQRPDGLVQVAGINPLAAHWPSDRRPTGSATMLNGRVLVVRSPNDAEAYAPGFKVGDIFRASGIHAAIASPMRSHGESIGSMICYFDHPREFDEEAAVPDDLGRAVVDVVGDGNAARLHGLHERERKALRMRGEQREGCRAQRVSHVGHVARSRIRGSPAMLFWRLGRLSPSP